MFFLMSQTEPAENGRFFVVILHLHLQRCEFSRNAHSAERNIVWSFRKMAEKKTAFNYYIMQLQGRSHRTHSHYAARLTRRCPRKTMALGRCGIDNGPTERWGHFAALLHSHSDLSIRDICLPAIHMFGWRFEKSPHNVIVLRSRRRHCDLCYATCPNKIFSLHFFAGAFCELGFAGNAFDRTAVTVTRVTKTKTNSIGDEWAKWMIIWKTTSETMDDKLQVREWPFDWAIGWDFVERWFGETFLGLTVGRRLSRFLTD